MKATLILVSLIVYASSGILDNFFRHDNPAYGYLTKYGIPEAERVRNAEKEFQLNKSLSRITGGSPASGQFKYQAGLISDIIGTTDRALCGGSLLTTNRLLTAAHCWYDGLNEAWRFTVVLGSELLFSGGTRVLTSNVTTHPDWNPLLNLNDIAIIRLPEPVTLSDAIGTISLPTGLEIFDDFAGQLATASGFGYTADGANITEGQFLSYVDMTVISNEVCNFFYAGIIRSSNICTNTFGGRSPCQGDSGGPLIVQKSNRTVLIGVTSFGISLGCEIGWPAVFARVTSFFAFINENL